MSDPHIKNQRVYLGDGSMFPLTLSLDHDLNGIDWRLRYAQAGITKADMYFLASVVDAYEALLFDATRARREDVVRKVRLAVKEANS